MTFIYKKLYQIFFLLIGTLTFSDIAYSQIINTCLAKGTANNLAYTVVLRNSTNATPAGPETQLFINAYSRISIFITPNGATPASAFVRLDGNLPNDSHVQRVFERSPRQTGVQTSNLFDIYFPLIRGTSNLLFSIYPIGTDPKNITESTPGIRCTIILTPIIEASTLLLDQENKERNVRVFQVSNAIPGNPEGNKSVEYFWTGRNLQRPNDIIVNAIAHVTEEHDTFLIKSLMFQQRDSATQQLVPVPIFIDPSNNDKAHLYFSTDSTGMARLNVTPKFTPAGGHLIYWPFADNTSEAARIVVYDPTILADDFFEPIPTKNPVKISSSKACDTPTFNIRNDDAKITENGRIYLLINDNYDNSIFSSSKKTITMNASNKFIATSSGDLPQSNNSRYVYLSENGNVNLSRKYSFFAYEGVASTLTTLDNTILNFCDTVTSQITNFDNRLSPANEIPPLSTPLNPSTTFGRIIAKYNATERLFEWFVTYEGLTGAATFAHFHGPAPTTASAPIIIQIETAAINTPISGRQILTEQQAQQLLSGLWYFNIHTAANLGGEIRGQLVPN